MLLDAAHPHRVEQAARLLVDGQLLGLPTETVYGLAARADDDAAVAQIYAAKGRPAGHPLIVHVADAQAAEAFVPAGYLQQLPANAARLMQAFWPGPLTVIVPRREGVAAAAAGQQPSVGLRSPSHPVAQAVLRAAQQLGVPGVAAPSANPFGRISPTTAQHVVQEFGDALTVLDGGACQVGIESTIIDCTRAQPVLLRPGAITTDMILERLNLHVLLPEAASAALGTAPKASGTLEAHYAPRAKVRIMAAADLQAALAATGHAVPALAVWSRTLLAAPLLPKERLQRMPDNAAEAAHALFAQLRAFDALGVEQIWVEAVPATPDWAGVADRLRRAASA